MQLGETSERKQMALSPLIYMKYVELNTSKLTAVCPLFCVDCEQIESLSPTATQFNAPKGKKGEGFISEGKGPVDFVSGT